MEENTLVKSERISIRIFQAICITIAVGLLLFLVVYYFSRALLSGKINVDTPIPGMAGLRSVEIDF